MTVPDILAFIQRQKAAFLVSVDEAGFSSQKAMLAPRKIKGGSAF